MERIIEVKNLWKVYRMGQERITAINNVDLDVYKNEICCLLGKSGSGKSTLINLIAGLEKPTKGEIIFNAKHHIEMMSENQLANLRKLNVGFVFQSYNLLPSLTALENVMLPLIFDKVPKKERVKRATRILNDVGLGDRINHRPSEMSGGQQQRVSIARAFINNPKMVFADEPTGNLDTKTTTEMMDLITGMVRENNQTLIIVTHDLELSPYADRIINMSDGKIESIKQN